MEDHKPYARAVLWKSDILITAGVFAKSLNIRDVQVGVDELLNKRHDSEGKPSV